MRWPLERRTASLFLRANPVASSCLGGGESCCLLLKVQVYLGPERHQGTTDVRVLGQRMRSHRKRKGECPMFPCDVSVQAQGARPFGTRRASAGAGHVSTRCLVSTHDGCPWKPASRLIALRCSPFQRRSRHGYLSACHLTRLTTKARL